MDKADKFMLGSVMLGLLLAFVVVTLLAGCEVLQRAAPGAAEGAVRAVQNDPTPFQDGQADLINYLIAAALGAAGSAYPAYRTGLKKPVPE
jgi:hypothetical protein